MACEYNTDKQTLSDRNELLDMMKNASEDVAQDLLRQFRSTDDIGAVVQAMRGGVQGQQTPSRQGSAKQVPSQVQMDLDLSHTSLQAVEFASVPAHYGPHSGATAATRAGQVTHSGYLVAQTNTEQDLDQIEEDFIDFSMTSPLFAPLTI